MNEELPDLRPLREVIESFGLWTRKSLGQHFLLDLNLTRRIARAAAPLDRTAVIEIGPGPGGLTRGLLAEGAQELIVVEKDTRCLAALAELEAAYPDRLRLVAGDALELALDGLAAPPFRIVSNLPYNISTVLLLTWLRLIHQRPDSIAVMVLMFQKEVAQRLVAQPRSKDYGRLSVMTQWLCQPKPCFEVPARAFVPPPKVTSTVIELLPRPTPLAAASLPALERVTAAAFGQRRKMLRQSLKSLGCDVGQMLTAASIEPTARAEEIPVEGFCALARAYEAAGAGA